MKKQTMITLALALTLAMPTMPAFAQKAMSKKEIAEKEKAFKNLQHPWKGKKRWLISVTPSPIQESRHQR